MSEFMFVEGAFVKLWSKFFVVSLVAFYRGGTRGHTWVSFAIAGAKIALLEITMSKKNRLSR